MNAGDLVQAGDRIKCQYGRADVLEIWQDGRIKIAGADFLALIRPEDVHEIHLAQKHPPLKAAAPDAP